MWISKMVGRSPIMHDKSKSKEQGKTQQVQSVTMVKSSTHKTSRVSKQDQAVMRKHMSGFLSGKQKSLSDSEAEIHVDHDNELSSSLDKVDLEMPVTLTGAEWADTLENTSDEDVAPDHECATGGSGDGNHDGIVHTNEVCPDLNQDESADDSTTTVCASSPSWADKVKGVSTGASHNRCVTPTNGSDSGSSVLKCGGAVIRHKSEVPPIFLAYQWVSAEGAHITLVQIPTSVIQAMRDDSVLDAVQLMKTGWYIYMHTVADRTRLVSVGITVAGCYIQLWSEFCPEARKSLKVMLRDLPLHSVDNEQVLHALNDICQVSSPVNFSNIWLNGQLTSIRNGDCFVYVDAADVSKLPDTLPVGKYITHIVKPVSMSTCKHCQGEGHQSSDQACPACAPQHMQDTVEAFCSGCCELSNLYKCPLGCVIQDKGMTFESSEHQYQVKKLKFHDKGAEAFELLMEEDSFKAMKKAKLAVPDDQVSDDWKVITKVEMLESNHLKYHSCAHAREKLLDSKLILAEAMGDPFWECLSDYWPGKNMLGEILMVVCDELQKSDNPRKHKAESPLRSLSKSSES